MEEHLRMENESTWTNPGTTCIRGIEAATRGHHRPRQEGPGAGDTSHHRVQEGARAQATPMMPTRQSDSTLQFSTDHDPTTPSKFIWESEDMLTQRQVNVYSSFIHSCQERETTPMSLHLRTENQSGAHSPSNRSHRTRVAAWLTLKCIVPRGKPYSKGPILYDFMHMTLWNRQNHRNGEQMSGCQGLRR